MCFEADLSSESPGALDARIIGERAEERMVGGGEVLKDGEAGANAVGAEVGEGGKGVLFVFEDETSDELGVEFYNHRRGSRGLLGRNGKGTGESEVEGGGVLRGGGHL